MFLFTLPLILQPPPPPQPIHGPRRRPDDYMTPPPPVYGPPERPENYLTPDFRQLPVETAQTCVRNTMMKSMYDKVALLLKYFRLPVVRHHHTFPLIAQRPGPLEDLHGHVLLLKYDDLMALQVT